MNNAKKENVVRAAPRLDRRLPSKPAAAPAGKRPRGVEGPVASGAAKLPAKTGEAPAAAIRKSLRLKAPTDPQALQAARKAALAHDTPPNFADQVPRRPTRPTAGEGAASPREQYVRITVHVAGDRLRVTDSHLVDGPLAQPLSFTGAAVYELSVGERMLYAASLPDIGVQRSFVDPANHPQRQGHFITERQTYDFHARVPAQLLKAKTLSSLRLTLHRIKEPLHADCMDDRRLAVQFEKRVRPIAELTGLPPSVLPGAIDRRGGRTPRA